MLWFAKNGKKYLDDKEQNRWDPAFQTLLSESTLGIVGFGSVGQECAKIAKHGYGMKVITCKRNPTKVTHLQESLADEILPSNEVGLARLFGESDFIVNCIPFTSDTINFYDLAKFK
jgi:phosphoglycerate dehydrogenase-like enzyme